MISFSLRFNSGIVLFGLVIVLAGCSGKTSVTGKVMNGNTPLTVGKEGFIEVIFVPENQEKDDRTYPAQVNSQEGTFEIPEIPKGKYKVTVKQMDPAPMNDVLKGAFALENTPLTADVDGKSPITIDIGPHVKK